MSFRLTFDNEQALRRRLSAVAWKHRRKNINLPNNGRKFERDVRLAIKGHVGDQPEDVMDSLYGRYRLFAHMQHFEEARKEAERDEAFAASYDDRPTAFVYSPLLNSPRIPHWLGYPAGRNPRFYNIADRLFGQFPRRSKMAKWRAKGRRPGPKGYPRLVQMVTGRYHDSR